jgi:hypothetical protein
VSHSNKVFKNLFFSLLHIKNLFDGIFATFSTFLNKYTIVLFKTPIEFVSKIFAFFTENFEATVNTHKRARQRGKKVV